MLGETLSNVMGKPIKCYGKTYQMLWEILSNVMGKPIKCYGKTYQMLWEKSQKGEIYQQQAKLGGKLPIWQKVFQIFGKT